METLAGLDQGVLYWFGSLRRDGLNEAMVWLTQLGGVKGLGVLSALLVVGFAAAKRYRFAVGFAALCLVSVALNYGTKIIVGRPRPDVVWQTNVPSNASFPSGHALCSMAIYTTAFALIGSMVGRPWLALVGVLLGLAIGLTRPYLGVHYPSDVLAGWVGGLGLALVAVPMILRPEPPPMSLPDATSPPAGGDSHPIQVGPERGITRRA